MIFGYMRISTQKEKQKTDRQKITLQQYARDNKFEFNEIAEEKISGTVTAENRPKFKTLRGKLRKDDILVVTDIDRLGRDANDVIMEFKKLKNEGIRVIALDTPYLNEWENVTNNNMYDMIADIFITLKAHMAQQEREKTVTRINQGLDAAKARGKKLGRKPVVVSDEFRKEYQKFKSGKYGDISAISFAKMLGIGRSTLYKYINLIETKEEK